VRAMNDDDLDRLRMQRERLVFDRFDQDTAWSVASRLRSVVADRGGAATIEVRLGGHTVVLVAMVGTAPENADWARRKRNVVELVHRSSYEVGRRDAAAGRSTLELMGLSDRDHATHGGAVPVRVRDLGVVGVVTVSGLPQRVDHELVVEVLAEHAGVAYADIALSTR
jgi:uncharacterized protein (UPF0303 family)